MHGLNICLKWRNTKHMSAHQMMTKYVHWSNENSHEMEINPFCVPGMDWQRMPRAFLYNDSFCNCIKDFNFQADGIYLCNLNLIIREFEDHGAVRCRGRGKKMNLD